MQMPEDMKAQGLSPVACLPQNIGQTEENRLTEVVHEKRSRKKNYIYILWQQTISIPGSGEHCLGLVVDFIPISTISLRRNLRGIIIGSQWLMENAQDYGFITQGVVWGKIRWTSQDWRRSRGITVMWG